MKIILVAEGSYPYVFGGVASWAQMLVEAMPEHEFEIIAISSSRKEAQPLKYKLPPNLIRIHNVYMMDFLEIAGDRAPRLNKQEERACMNWFEFKESAEEALPVIANPAKFGNPLTFLKHETFWGLLVESYRNEMPHDSFNAYFSAWRSVYMPAVHLLQQPYPTGDVYHSVSTGYAGLVASYLRMMHGTPFILSEHGLYAREREEEIRQSAWIGPAFKKRWSSFFNQLSRIAYKSADRTVALYGDARRTQLELGVPPERSRVIPNGVDYGALSVLPRPADLSGSEKFIFGAVVRVVPIKDIKSMLYAASIAGRIVPNMQLWIMGPTEEDPDYYKECLQLADNLRIEHLVEFTGPVQLSDRLPKVDALILSSISEGQPLAVLEGMAAGIPLVCTDAGSCRELLEGRDADDAGAAGYVVPPSNPEAMAEAMVDMYRYPEQRNRMGQAGKMRVEKHYRNDQLIGAYRRLYEEVMN